MILSDRDIKSRLKKGDLVIAPIDEKVQVGPSSVDLRLGNRFRVFKLSDHAMIDLADYEDKKIAERDYEDKKIMEIKIGDARVGSPGKENPECDSTKIEEYEYTRLYISNKPFILHPGEFVLASLHENVKVPRDLVGRLEGRSSLGRIGLMVHSTAGVVAPGFEGNLTLELANVGKLPIKLYPGMRICQIVFEELKSPAEISYGERKGSKYQNQSGATESKIEKGK